jgi:hypothetical protein
MTIEQDEMTCEFCGWKFTKEYLNWEEKNGEQMCNCFLFGEIQRLKKQIKRLRKRKK